MIEMHYPVKGDLPELSGEMHEQRKPVLAYTKSLGWTQAIRMQGSPGEILLDDSLLVCGVGLGNDFVA